MKNTLISLMVVLVLAACGAQPDAVAPTNVPETATVEAPDDTSPTEENTVPSPTAEPTANPFDADGPLDVTLTTEDGTTLDGTLYGPANATTALVLVPQYPGEQQGWRGFAESAGEAGLRALTFDLRGYGDSGGERNETAAPEDVQAALDFIRNEVGLENIVLIGAVQGGTAAAKIVAQGAQVDGLVVLSAPQTTAADGLTVEEAELASITVPSLWIGARQDLIQEVEALYNAAGSTDKTLWIYETSAVPGTELFNGLDATDLRERLLTFAQDVSQ